MNHFPYSGTLEIRQGKTTQDVGITFFIHVPHHNNCSLLLARLVLSKDMRIFVARIVQFP